MYIDFHTHAFNKKIAERAITELEERANQKALTRGSVEELLEKMEEWKIDKSVLLPIATKPSQQKIINDWAAPLYESTDDKIIPFGSVHPDATDALEELERIKNLGLFGIKLHPDYQGFLIEDEKAYPIYDLCSELELPIVFHAGYDCYSPSLIHTRPEGAKKVHEKFPRLKIVLAHMGGCMLWNKVYDTLAGLDGEIYFDTSFTSENMSQEMFEKMINKHGTDRILLASDCPWDNPTKEIKMIEKLSLSDTEKKKIYSENAIKILKLNGGRK